MTLGAGFRHTRLVKMDDPNAKYRGVSATLMLKVHPEDGAKLAIPGGTKPDDMHVTLGYWGDVQDAKINYEELKHLAEKVRPFLPSSVWLNERDTALFGDNNDILVLVLDNDRLQRARTILKTHCRSDGVECPSDKHGAYKPHITLGQVGQDDVREVAIDHSDVRLTHIIVTYGTDETLVPLPTSDWAFQPNNLQPDTLPTALVEKHGNKGMPGYRLLHPGIGSKVLPGSSSGNAYQNLQRKFGAAIQQARSSKEFESIKLDAAKEMAAGKLKPKEFAEVQREVGRKAKMAGSGTQGKAPVQPKAPKKKAPVPPRPPGQQGPPAAPKVLGGDDLRRRMEADLGNRIEAATDAEALDRLESLVDRLKMEGDIRTRLKERIADRRVDIDRQTDRDSQRQAAREKPRYGDSAPPKADADKGQIRVPGDESDPRVAAAAEMDAKEREFESRLKAAQTPEDLMDISQSFMGLRDEAQFDPIKDQKSDRLMKFMRQYQAAKDRVNSRIADEASRAAQEDLKATRKPVERDSGDEGPGWEMNEMGDRVFTEEEEDALIISEEDAEAAMRAKDVQMSDAQRKQRNEWKQDPASSPAGKMLEKGASLEDTMRAAPGGLFEYVMDNDERFDVEVIGKGILGAYSVTDKKTGKKTFFKETVNGRPDVAEEDVAMYGDGTNEVLSSMIGKSVLGDMVPEAFFADDPAGQQAYMIGMEHIENQVPEGGAIRHDFTRAKAEKLADRKQPLAIHLFDFFINNNDRHLENVVTVTDKDGKQSLFPIDNGAAFLAYDQYFFVDENEYLDKWGGPYRDVVRDAPEAVGYNLWKQNAIKESQLLKLAQKAYKGDEAALLKDAQDMVKKFQSVDVDAMVADVMKRFPNLDQYERSNLTAAARIFKARQQNIHAPDVAKWITGKRKF